MATLELQNVYRHPRYDHRSHGTSHSHYQDTLTSATAFEDAQSTSQCRGTCTLDEYHEDAAWGLDEDIAVILRSKCPVIASAREQMRRLLDESDRILNDGPGIGNSNRSVWLDVLQLVARILHAYNARRCLALLALLAAFAAGVLLGAASCGTCLRRIDSPILSCINAALAPGDRKYSGVT